MHELNIHHYVLCFAMHKQIIKKTDDLSLYSITFVMVNWF